MVRPSESGWLVAVSVLPGKKICLPGAPAVRRVRHPEAALLDHPVDPALVLDRVEDVRVLRVEDEAADVAALWTGRRLPGALLVGDGHVGAAGPYGRGERAGRERSGARGRLRLA